MMTLRCVGLAFAVLLAAAGCGKEEGGGSDPKSGGNGDQPSETIDATAEPAPADAAAEPAGETDAAAAAAGETDAAVAANGDNGGDNGDNGGDNGGGTDTAEDKAPTNLKVLSKKWDRKKVTNYMKKQINRGLGVKCKFCHEGKDYASDKNKHKLVARKMITMTNKMNRKYFGGKSKITCFTCHKGKAELD